MGDVWYNNGEFTKFKISNHKDASTARSNESQPYKNLLKAYRAAESTNESSVITSLQKWLDSSDPSESYRGIEDIATKNFLIFVKVINIMLFGWYFKLRKKIER